MKMTIEEGDTTIPFLATTTTINGVLRITIPKNIKDSYALKENEDYTIIIFLNKKSKK